MVKRFQDFPELIGVKCFKTYENLTIVINSMINIVSILTTVTYVVKLMRDLVSWDDNIIKLAVFAINALVIVLVIEPEKLKCLTVLTTIIFMSIGKFLLSQKLI